MTSQPSIPEQMGTLIRAARERKGLTREELAPRIGVALATLYRWEKGNSKKGPTIAKLRILAAALDCQLEDFWPSNNGERAA